jgi:GTP-binding protein HflX
MICLLLFQGKHMIDNQSAHDKRRALLAGVCTGNEHDFQVGMDELERLAVSCDMDPVRRVTQHLPWEDKATCAGPGKIEEIRALADAEEADVVIFNNSLSPAQIANLTKLLDVEVLDRTALILQIFAEHASSREATIQVEYARLQYTLPRLVGMRRNLSRQGGGSGSLSNKGAGEMQIELDRRHIERRMTVLRRELQKISTNREIQRRQRTRNRLPLVSMVGYTNAGKSTLMNALIDRCEDLHDATCQKTEPGESFKTDSLQNDQLYLQSDQSHLQNNQLRKKENSRHVFVKDMVFATLDTSVRRIEPAGAQPFLLSDTVGFINDLPAYLVEAFHSTLEEVLKADLILEVIDSSDPEHAMQMEVTDRTLQELGAGSIPRIRVMNKADLTEPSGISLNNDGIQRQDLIRLSAKRGDGIDQLVCMIEEKLNGETAQVTVMIPYHRMGMSETLRKNARVLAEEYTQDGLRMDVRMDIALLRTFRDYIVK